MPTELERELDQMVEADIFYQLYERDTESEDE